MLYWQQLLEPPFSRCLHVPECITCKLLTLNLQIRPKAAQQTYFALFWAETKCIEMNSALTSRYDFAYTWQVYLQLTLIIITIKIHNSALYIYIEKGGNTLDNFLANMIEKCACHMTFSDTCENTLWTLSGEQAAVQLGKNMLRQQLIRHFCVSPTLACSYYFVGRNVKWQTHSLNGHLPSGPAGLCYLF